MKSFGEDLRSERISRGVALEEITAITKISRRHLVALEQEKFRLLPGGILSKGIIRGYLNVKAGDFERVQGHIGTYFWNMPVEDNAFLILTTGTGKAAFLHATWTEWKNLFSLEIYGRQGKLEISGLGGSYGVERLAYYRMSPEMGPPETTIWEYPMADNSWDTEFAEFLEDIRLRRDPVPGIRDAQAALRVIEKMYQVASR